MRKPSTRVMEIFSEAATSDAGRREAYLQRACGGDAELRAEVESLLATQHRASRFLDAPTVEGEGGDEEQADSRFDIDSIEGGPAQVGRYSIVERIGEGGFGVVYRARQNHPIRREVALKIVKLGMDTRQVIARFESERQALARMDHPNIARIFDAGATVDGRPYFAMELVDGPPITAYCDVNRLPVERRLGLFVAVCQAVQHAHQKGIIHRDLKPSNILVAQVDGAAVPKVIDFGIAKAMSPDPHAHAAVTEVRHFVGTLDYMSPEQAGAGTGDVDTRSDIYSLGVLLYELLTGVTPFGADELRKSCFESVHRAIREQDPPRPSARLSAMGTGLAEVAGRRGLDGQKLRRTVSGELEWVVARAMEKDRGRRYETAAALGDDIRRYLAREPVLAGPPDTLYRVRKFASRHRRSLLAASAVAVALLLGLAGMTFGLVRAKRDRHRAEAALAEAEQVSMFLTNMLRSADPDRAKGAQVLVRDVLDRTSTNLDDGSLKDRPLVEAGIRNTLGASYDSLGLYVESERQYRRALEIREGVLGATDRETAKAMVALSGALGNVGDFVGAESMGRRALAIQEKVLGPDHTETIGTHLRVSWYIRARGDYEAAEVAMRRGVELCRRPSQHGRLAGALTNLGVVLLDQRKLDDAEAAFAEALALDRALHGDQFRNVARNMSNLAAVRSERGDWKGAQAYWEEALRLQRAMLPADHPDIAWTLRLLGSVRGKQNDLAGAERDLKDALAMEQRLFRPRHPIFAPFLADLAVVLERAGKRDEAVAARKEALEVRLEEKETALKAHPRSITDHASVAELRFRRGDFDGALAHADALLRLRPEDARWMALSAGLRLYRGEEHAYQDIRARMLKQSVGMKDPQICALVAALCLVRQPAETEMARVMELVERGTNGRPDDSWSQLARGLAEYRVGHFAGAVEWLGKAQQSAHDAPMRSAAAQWRAMAAIKLGLHGEAVAARGVAAAEYQKVRRVEDGDLGLVPEGWLICQLARRDAEESPPQ